ncbi:hypothetical protein GHO24_25770, partial [Pseudomonas sp. FSL A6-1183]|nr:hypothetical protein [Pseudomonas sp. FSL A6-1183]
VYGACGPVFEFCGQHLARSARETRIWLLQAPPGQALDADRLGDWHTALEKLGLPFAASAPLNWLETGHD